MVQLVPLLSHATPSPLASLKFRISFPFWCQLIQAVLEKETVLKMGVCMSRSYICNTYPNKHINENNVLSLLKNSGCIMVLLIYNVLITCRCHPTTTTITVKVLCPTRHKIGHYRNVLPSQSLGTVLKKLNLTQQEQTNTRTK